MMNKYRFRNKEDFNEEHASSVFPSMARYGTSLKASSNAFFSTLIIIFILLAQSKLALLLWTRELQKRLTAEETPIIAICLHPGSVNTDGNQRHIAEANAFVRPLFKVVTSLFFIAPTKGAVSSSFAAAAPVVRAEADKYKGSFLTETGGFNKVPATGKDDALAKEFWDTSEALLKEIGV